MVLFFSCACAPHVQDDTSLETLDQLQGNPGTGPVDKLIDSAAVAPSPEGSQEGRNPSPTLNGSDDPPRESKLLALEKAGVSPVPDSKPAASLFGGSILEENSRTGQTTPTGASARIFDGVALGSSAFCRLGATSPRRSWNNLSSFSETEKSSVPREHRHLVALAALLPQRVIENLVMQRRTGKPGKPRYATACMDAALLFVDISGYTSSMEMFAQQGAQGIEKFWKMFNAYFCDLLDIIQGTGGDIDCFAGDAILIVYETESIWKRTGESVRKCINTLDDTQPTKLCLATMAAAQCGGRLLNKLSPYNFSDGANESSLTLHGSIGAGSLRTVNIGGTTAQAGSSFATFVCGGVFEQLAIAHGLSRKNEICLSGKAVALTGYWLDLWDHPEHETCKILKGVREFGDGKQQQQQQQQPESGLLETQASTSAAEGAEPPGVLQGLNPAKATMPSLYTSVPKDNNVCTRLNMTAPEYDGLTEDLKGFIPSSVLDKMESVRGDAASGIALGELRQGTVGFVKFDIRDINSSACINPEDGIKEVAQVAMMGFREVLIAGGYVNKVIMDEKGLVLLYAFGTPGCSYEYNNLHAIRVALMIIKSSNERFKRKTGVGIATGHMCTGIIGKPNFRSEYALAGDVVNLAARLAAASEKGENGVLCDEATLQSLTGEESIHHEAMVGIEVVSVGSMRPKGKSYDINVFQLNNVRNIRREHLKREELEKTGKTLAIVPKRSIKFVPVESRARPLEQIRTFVKRCSSGEINCVYLESDSGLGKSELVAAFTNDPGIKRACHTVLETTRGENVSIKGRDTYVVKMQGAHLEQSTPYHVLSGLTAALMAIIVEPDCKGRIDMTEFAASMPTEVHRYLELLRYLRIPMSKAVKSDTRRSMDAGGVKGWLRRQRRNSSSASRSLSTFQTFKSGASVLSSNSSRSAGYRFQRFEGEGGEDESQFESAMLLGFEAAEFLCSKMRSCVPIEDRDYGSTTFKKSFIGSQAVDWMCDTGIAASRNEAVAIGQRLVEFGLVDHVNSVFRFKDELLFYEFRTKGTNWPKATEMNVDAAKALAIRMNMEIEMKEVHEHDGEVHKACFSGDMLTEWMINEYVATCVNEAVAIADKLMTLSIIESTSSTNAERFRPSCDSFYVLKGLALSALPPTHIFGLLKQLCLAILQVACACAAEDRQLVVIVVEDLQWVDSGTLDMILAFLQEAEQEGPWDGGCMFLLSTRPASTFPAHLSGTRDKIVAERIVTVIELGALSEEEAEGVTCRLLEVDELDFALRKLVLTSCSGSPLFITELCQSLCSTQGVQKVSTSSGKSRAALKTTGKDGGLSTGPRSVSEIVAARIDTLESTASLVLKVAAVIGEKFTFNVLHAVFPVDVDEATLATHLNSLVSKNFLTVENPSAMMQGTLCFKFNHSLMSSAAYGMLLHSNRWNLHYRVAVVLTEQGDQSYMVLARHWLQVALGNPSAAEIADLGGHDVYREHMHMTVELVSKAIGELMGRGQFIDASLYFNDGLGVLKRMADTPRRKCLEIDLLLQGCRLTSFIEGYTTTLVEFARKAYTLACEETEGVQRESRLRAVLYIAQYEVMYGNASSTIEKLKVLFDLIPSAKVVLRIEPAAILAAILTQRGQFKQARVYTNVVAEWKAAGRPVPLCLVMYEPVVTLMSINIILAAVGADDSKHLRWLNELDSYLKSNDSGVSKKPFNLYASMSLFGMLYPMCFEYAEMFRFYHSVYHVVYHPQVLLPIRRGLMFQVSSATSRVQAKNVVITQGVEIMSLMCQVYQSITSPVTNSKKPKQYFSQLMSIVRSQPTPAACAAVYQAARLLRLWDRARESLQLWDALPSFESCEGARRNANAGASDATFDEAAVYPPIDKTADTISTALRPRASSTDSRMTRSISTDSRGHLDAHDDDLAEDVPVDIYGCILLFCKGDTEMGEVMDKRCPTGDATSPARDQTDELQLEKTRLAAELFGKAADGAALIGNGLMEVRASSACARLLWETLDQGPDARRRLRQIFEKFDTLCSLPNFFTPLRLTGLTAAMRLNSDMGGCSEDGDTSDKDEYGFGAMHAEDSGDSEDSSDDSESDDSGQQKDTITIGDARNKKDGEAVEERGGGEEEDEENEEDEEDEEDKEDEHDLGKAKSDRVEEPGGETDKDAATALAHRQNQPIASPQPASFTRSSLKDTTLLNQSVKKQQGRNRHSVRFTQLPEEDSGDDLGEQVDVNKGDISEAESSRERKANEPAQAAPPPLAEEVVSNDEPTADSLGTGHIGEEERVRGSLARAQTNRRTSGPINVATLILPHRPKAKRESSCAPHRGGAHRKLSPVSGERGDTMDEGG